MSMQSKWFDAAQQATNAWMALASQPPATVATAAQEYLTDAAQRSVLLWDTLRRRGNIYLEHEEAGRPPVLSFPYEMVLDGRTLERPSNYFLVRIIPDMGQETDPRKRPFVIFDPRAGHGPGIGGSKADSQVGAALRAGHPCYFVGFHPEPVAGQTLASVAYAEARFLEEVTARHPEADGKPCIIGNCQGGWAIMGLSAIRPDLPGPVILSGSPLSYWAGVEGGSPMRYLGGLVGGSWMTSLAGDLGHGKFDGGHLVSNFESYNLANTHWGKLYNLYAKIDTEPERYLNFEKWWGGLFLMNLEEMRSIVNNLFVGNKLARGEIVLESGERLDLKRIKSPIVVFASFGDEITPPQQALNWLFDLYDDLDDLRAHGQTIIYVLHKNIGHLGIFVSATVAKREHTEFVTTLDQIDMLPPGLYEMVIEDKRPDSPGAELVPGDYLVRFEARTLDDIRSLDDTREDERRFAAVARLSEINEGLYLTFLSPILRKLINEESAQRLRQLSPKRLERRLWSDANPWLAWLPAAAATVAEQRRPIAEGNPFLALQRAVSAQIEATLEALQAVRDQGSEQSFKSLYDSPLLLALLGLESSSAVSATLSPPREAGHRELIELRARELRGRLAAGGPLEGVVRMLAYLGKAEGVADHRRFRFIQRVKEQYPHARALSREDFKHVVRDQMGMLLIDEEAALAALPNLVPEAQRTEAMGLVRDVASVTGELSPETESRMQRLQQALELAPGEAPRQRAVRSV